jgi:hypothetical protein
VIILRDGGVEIRVEIRVDHLVGRAEEIGWGGRLGGDGKRRIHRGGRAAACGEEEPRVAALVLGRRWSC